ncbi:MAG: DUF4832 domain-containing protein [Bacteroidales bacterium]|nr:DUF4832 domain-containing protein [Bacteroidales bacterium]
MKRSILWILAALALVAVGCRNAGRKGENRAEAVSEWPGYTQVALSSQIQGVQPMTGIVLWTTNDKKDTDAIQLEYSYMLYNEVCKEKDVYDWTPVENLLADIASRGHQAVIRFRYVYVGQECSAPDYIKALPDYEETVGLSEGRRTCFPDWRNEELQRFHLEFHRRFAEKYDNDPRLAFLETGYGLWAEYHIYDGPFIEGQTFPSKEFQAKFFQEMEGWFKHTPWCISIDAADPKYGPFDQYPDLLEGSFGNFDDSFMSKDHDDYNLRSWRYFGEERYRRAPLGGEFNYYTRFDQEHCLDREGMHGRTFEGEVSRFHMTFIIGNDQTRFQPMERIKEASMSMGYRFRIGDFLVRKRKGAAVYIENTGVAPIYHDAYVAVNGVRGDYNLRDLMPGQGVWVRIDSRRMPASPAVTIECDRLVPGQRIEYEADIRVTP